MPADEVTQGEPGKGSLECGGTTSPPHPPLWGSQNITNSIIYLILQHVESMTYRRQQRPNKFVFSKEKNMENNGNKNT